MELFRKRYIPAKPRNKILRHETKDNGLKISKDNNKYQLNTYMRSTCDVFTQIKSYSLYVERKPKIYNRFNNKNYELHDTLILKSQPIGGTRMNE